MPDPPWARPHGIDAVVDSWLQNGDVTRCLAAEKLLPATEAHYADVPKELSPGLRTALAKRGVDRLYSHQAEAIRHALEGRHTVIATPTASGKSFCFHMPVLDAVAKDPASSAIYLYPTKALSRDQENGVLALIEDAQLKAPAAVYDGDTPGDARRAARERSRLVLTNPDMLHSGILPNHAKWATLFRSLKYVVIDELHTYRGVFGTHMAHVVARLKRIAAFHGSNPTFICATATIGNPRAHSARLLGVEESEVALVDESGAPQSSRHLLLYNPPVVNAELGVRKSALKEAVGLARDLVRAKVPTIVFGQSRNSVEVMLKYLRESCRDVASPNAIMGYRGGYLPDTRRRVENGLRDGDVLCVVATNALELGIDIGDLEAVICVGYPGSVAGLWQRFGRAGRRGATSIAVMVCSSNPLDQFLARDPEYLLNAGAEEARIDPGNVEVLVQHLKCAAFEAPFETPHTAPRTGNSPPPGERYSTLDPEATRQALEYLGGHGLVHESRGRFHWTGEGFPATSVSLRNIGWDNFVIVNVETDKSIAELDWRAAHTMLHEQAIYQHDAEQYQVEKLDYENHKAFVRKVEPDYFTTALTYRTVSVLDELATAPLARVDGGWGEIKVVEKVTGYKKIKFFTHENAGYGDVHLPEMQMHTTSFWMTVPEALLERLGLPRADLLDGLRGVGHALETVCALALMCDPRDIGQTLGDGADDESPAGRDPHSGRTGKFDPTIFLFDAQPGGVGLAERIFEKAPELLMQAKELIRGCRCDQGCPGCVGPSSAGPPFDPAARSDTVRMHGRKQVALDALDLLGFHDVTAEPPTVAEPSVVQ